jgi:hypothetical protein
MGMPMTVIAVIVLALALGFLIVSVSAALWYGMGHEHHPPTKGLDFDQLTPAERQRVPDS